MGRGLGIGGDGSGKSSDGVLIICMNTEEADGRGVTVMVMAGRDGDRKGWPLFRRTFKIYIMRCHYFLFLYFKLGKVKSDPSSYCHGH